MEGSATPLLLLFTLAVAAGAHLPILLLVPALLWLLPNAVSLVPEMAPLGSPAVGALGATLLVTGVALRGVPFLRGAWQGFLAPASLAATISIGLVLLEGRPAILVLPALLTAVGLTALLQAARLGARLLHAVLPDRPLRRLAALREGAAVLAAALLVATAAVSPPGGVFLAGLLVMGAVGPGRAAVRAGGFLLVLGRGVLRHLNGASGWRPATALPRWLPGSPAAGARAALAGDPATGGFRGGWLIQEEGELRFAYRTAFRVWEVSLAAADRPRGDPRPWAWLARLESGGGPPPVLVLPRDGPHPDRGLGSETAPAGSHAEHDL